MKLMTGISAIAFSLILTPCAMASGGPKCIGKICLDNRRVEIRDITKLYGKTNSVFGSDILYHCYRVGKNAFLRVGFMEIEKSITDVLLTKNQPCPPTKMPKFISKQLATESGIGIGSSREEVQARYGQPKEIIHGTKIYSRWLSSDSGIYHDPQNLSDLWMYSPPTSPNLIRGIGFDGDKVASIYIQD